MRNYYLLIPDLKCRYIMPLWVVVLLFCTSIISGCTDQKPKEATKKKPPTQEELFEINQQLMNEEKTRIQHFVDRKKWPVQSSRTGLKYWIYHTSEGDSIRERDVVKILYTISLITGDTCYTRLKIPEEIMVDFDEVESGLHEGIKYMKKGEKAMLVMPPHLAHGLVGDLNKIPMNATLIYDIHVIAE